MHSLSSSRDRSAAAAITVHRLGFPCGSAGEEAACNAGDLGLIPGLERSPGEGKGCPLHFFWPREFHGLNSPWSQRVGHD